MAVDSTGVAPIGTSSIISPLLPEKESTLQIIVSKQQEIKTKMKA